MTPDPTYQTVASLELPTIRRRRFLPVVLVGAGLLLLGGRAKSVVAEQQPPSAPITQDAMAGMSPATAAPADSQAISPGPIVSTGQAVSGPHYPAFSIGSDDVIRRSLSNSPVLPSLQSVLRAPYFSQFDGSDYAETNCGPTSLAMALGAVGVPATPLGLRALANVQMKTSDPNEGTSWESLVYAAKQNGVSVFGLTNGASNTYRQWTIADLRSELAKQRPVLMLIRYHDLPDHKTSSFAGDHYVVALGTDGADNIIYNDPASNDGSNLVVSTTQLLTAWRDPASGLAYTAMSLYR